MCENFIPKHLKVFQFHFELIFDFNWKISQHFNFVWLQSITWEYSDELGLFGFEMKLKAQFEFELDSSVSHLFPSQSPKMLNEPREKRELKINCETAEQVSNVFVEKFQVNVRDDELWMFSNEWILTHNCCDHFSNQNQLLSRSFNFNHFKLQKSQIWTFIDGDDIGSYDIL